MKTNRDEYIGKAFQPKMDDPTDNLLLAGIVFMMLMIMVLVVWFILI